MIKYYNMKFKSDDDLTSFINYIRNEAKIDTYKQFKKIFIESVKKGYTGYNCAPIIEFCDDSIEKLQEQSKGLKWK